MMAHAWTRQRRALVAVLTTIVVAVIASASPDATPPVAAQSPAPFVLLGQPIEALRPAERIAAPIAGPASSVPAEIARVTEANTVSFNTCTGNLVRDDQGNILGIVGAAHCVRPSSNVMGGGYTFGTGDIVAIGRSDIRMDAITDLFFAGLDGRTAADVQAQLILNYERVDVGEQSASALAVMTGYPRFNNPRNEPVTFPLRLAGIVHWPHDRADTIAAFGDWNSQNQSCSPGASGSGLYVHLDGHGYLIIGVLSSRAEFERVQTMPYSTGYGLELRRYFEDQLDRTIDADFLCGFAPPTAG